MCTYFVALDRTVVQCRVFVSTLCRMQQAGTSWLLSNFDQLIIPRRAASALRCTFTTNRNASTKEFSRYHRYHPEASAQPCLWLPCRRALDLAAASSSRMRRRPV